MANELLLDTGAFVALADRSERRHADCVAVLEAWTGTILTTEAVLTETLYLVAMGAPVSDEAAMQGIRRILE